MSPLRRWTISATAVTAAFVTAAAGAQASTSVQAAIKRQDKSIAQSAAAKKIITAGQVSKSQISAVIKEFDGLAAKLDRAAGVVAKASAATAQDKTGQTDWVTGARDEAKGLAQFVVAFKAIEHGQKAAAEAQQKAAAEAAAQKAAEAKAAVEAQQKTFTTASKLDVKADTALHLPAGD